MSHLRLATAGAGLVVRREAPPRVSVRDGIRTLAVTLAIDEAARTGLRVPITS